MTDAGTGPKPGMRRDNRRRTAAAWRRRAGALRAALRSRTGGDVLIVATICLAAIVAASLTDANHRFVSWAAGVDQAYGIKLDALPVALAAAGFGFGWFAWRRWKQFRQESLAHRETELRLREALALAEAADRSKSEFLATMSHELRTPLNAIIGFSEIIHGERFGELRVPRYKEYAGEVVQAGQHLLAVIGDILDIAKLEGGGEWSERMGAVDAGASAHAVASMLRERALARGLTLEVDALPSAESPAVWANERRLKQVLLNLVGNAIKFTEPGGRVSLTVQAGASGHAEPYVVFTVADSGIGMTAEEVMIALTPFAQVQSDISRQHQGTGLGLPIASRLVGAMGGHLHVDSAHGRGTRISFRLPAAAQEEVARSAA